MSLPVIPLVRGWPTDLRELDRVLSDLNRNVRKSRNRVHADKHQFTNQIAVANKQSTQSLQPLSSTDSGGGFAEIAVAAHTVQNGDGEIDYNPGTISGLLNATLYYVYTQDADFEGGSVSYAASTNPNSVTNSKNRYYLGKITTAAGGGGGTNGGYGGGGGGGGFPLP